MKYNSTCICILYTTSNYICLRLEHMLMMVLTRNIIYFMQMIHNEGVGGQRAAVVFLPFKFSSFIY